MNNLQRELAPVSDAAWAQIEDEARRTFTRAIAGRRVVDVVGPVGPTLSAVTTGHLRSADGEHHHTGVSEGPLADVIVDLPQSQPVLRLRAPFTLARDAVDAVERGAQDSDWQPVKDAATKIALAEDHAIFSGSRAHRIVGIAPSSSNPRLTLPSDITAVPATVAEGLAALLRAGVDGPYRLALSAELYTAVGAHTESGYPIREHLTRLLRGGTTEHTESHGHVLWAPALDGALLISTRGGDYELHLGQDLSIGYLSHDATQVELYLQESLTFLAFTAEASVVLTHD